MLENFCFKHKQENKNKMFFSHIAEKHVFQQLQNKERFFLVFHTKRIGKHGLFRKR